MKGLHQIKITITITIYFVYWLNYTHHCNVVVVATKMIETYQDAATGDTSKAEYASLRDNHIRRLNIENKNLKVIECPCVCMSVCLSVCVRVCVCVCVCVYNCVESIY